MFGREKTLFSCTRSVLAKFVFFLCFWDGWKRWLLLTVFSKAVFCWKHYLIVFSAKPSNCNKKCMLNKPKICEQVRVIFEHGKNVLFCLGILLPVWFVVVGCVVVGCVVVGCVVFVCFLVFWGFHGFVFCFLSVWYNCKCVKMLVCFPNFVFWGVFLFCFFRVWKV